MPFLQAEIIQTHCTNLKKSESEELLAGLRKICIYLTHPESYTHSGTPYNEPATTLTELVNNVERIYLYKELPEPEVVSQPEMVSQLVDGRTGSTIVVSTIQPSTCVW